MPSRRSSTSQCVVRDGNRRCRRVGEGDPPICKVCRAGMDVDRTPLGVMIEGLLSGKPPTRSTIEDAMADLASRITGRPITTDEVRQFRERAEEVREGFASSDWQAKIDRAMGRIPGAGRPPPPPPPPPADDGKAKARSAARKTLGFSAKEPLTAEQVKARQRELAKKHHPDRGGSHEKMSKINDAVDVLLSPV